MSKTITGKVTSRSKAGTGIKIDGGDWMNGNRAVLADAEWKSTVTVELDDEGKIVKVVAGETAPAASGGGSGGKGNWVDNQPVIAFQSARNAAMQMFNISHAAGTVKLPAKEADGLEAIEKFVIKYTEIFYNQAMDLRKGDPVDVVLYGEEDDE